MSGLGSRFKSAGYEKVKPLIEVHGKPIIQWVVDLFPGEENFTFICRKDHLKETNMMTVLEKIKPTGKIIGIDGHKKGPVYAISKAFEHIDDNQPVITNYCDFFQDWNYLDYKKFLEDTKCDGSIPCYTGFHPHLLHEKNLYAGCKVDQNNRLIEIREKFSFTEDKTKTQHSGGTYHFANGKLMKKYFIHSMETDNSLNNEFYISLVYNQMVQDGLDIRTYTKVPHFCQWGTPEDLEEYLYWASIFKKNNKGALRF
jgi:NDP-sugar pyrophosphorylase family protein